MSLARLRPRRDGRGSSLRDLRGVLAGRDFRHLLGTRLISQMGDGIFTAGVGAYVFFSQTTFPNPGAAAAAFAVLYLPYSLVGPFVGVFIDRWSRRQILLMSALLRAVVVGLIAVLVAGGRLGLPLYVSVLVALGVNRFFLAALSAALPHVVAGDKLVMANAVAPTAGTIAAFVGGVAALGLHFAMHGGRGGSALTLLSAAACYLIAGTVAATMRRDLLGPPPLPPGERRAGIGSELLVVLAGLASGAKHVWDRRPVAAALGATASQRAMFGLLLLSSILLFRNYFYVKASANTSLGGFSIDVVALAIGYGVSAVLTPVVTRRLSKAAWIAILLGLGALVTGAAGPTFTQAGFALIALALGVVGQGVAICTTTIIQERMHDDYRGRVFAFYDVFFNLPFVLAAVLAAQFIPDNGKSLPLIVVAAAGYLATAAGYAAVSRAEVTEGPSRPPGPGAPDGATAPDQPPSGAAPSGPDASPSTAAHRSSS